MIDTLAGYADVTFDQAGIRWLRRRDVELLALTPVPWSYEVTLPHTPFRCRRIPFEPHVHRRVFSVGQRPPFGDHPAVQILAGGAAKRHNAVITVAILRLTRDGPVADLIGKSERRKLPAANLPFPEGTRLTAFGGINPV